MKKTLTLLLALATFSCIAQPTSWDLLWSDEFSGTSLNTSNWTPEIGDGGWGNNEWQYYTANTENVSVSDGSLHIKALKQLQGNGSTLYTSSRLISKDLFEFQYGKIEARMRLPMGQGLWPAFWMLGANISEVSWPNCGEVDIMEHINNENKIYGTVHWNNNGQNSEGGNKILDPSEYHIYGAIWDDQTIKFYVDGIFYETFNLSFSNNSAQTFQKPFFLLLNLAIGGNWPGYPDDQTIFPATMDVDYVRVFQPAITSVNDPLNFNGISVFPNPFDEHIQVNSKHVVPASFRLINITGEIVLQGNLFNQNNNIDTSTLSSGIYCLEVTDADKSTQVFKITK